MTNHPTGDTALSRAITTGAPVATNDKQAAELTQRWGVWMKDNTNGFLREAWTLHGDGDETYDNKADAESAARRYNTFFDNVSYEVRPYPTPTPRPTPGGEWYAVFGAVSLNGNAKANAWVAGGDMPRMERIFCESRERAEWLSERLNAADAMEKALKADKLCNSIGTGNNTPPSIERELRAMGIEPDRYNGWCDMLDSLRDAALRGGA